MLHDSVNGSKILVRQPEMRSSLSGTTENTRPSRVDTLDTTAIERGSLPHAYLTEERLWAEEAAARYTPAYIVVDELGAELLRSERLKTYITLPPITGDAHVVALACDDLRGVLRHLLDQAALLWQPVRANRVSYTLQQPDGSSLNGYVDLLVQPMPEFMPGKLCLMILFFDLDDNSVELNSGVLVAQAAATSASELSANQEQARLMASIVPALLFTTAPDLSVRDINQSFYDYIGLSEGQFLAGGWDSVIHPDDRAENHRRWKIAVEQGEVFEHEHRLRAANGDWRWFLSRSVPQRDAQGKLVRWFGSAVDIDQRRRDEIRQRRLLAEVQHRAKNILAVIRSLLSRTLETATDLEDFAAHLSGRIGALARTQTALGRTIDGAVSLQELAHQEVVAQGGQVQDQVSIDGPAVMLTDKVAETLGLALHELATNALKFGALSMPEGRIKIWWTATPCDGDTTGQTRLEFCWEESGISLPQQIAPHSGFGRELIERGLPYELDATTKLQFGSQGVQCNIAMTLKNPPEGGPLVDNAA